MDYLVIEINGIEKKIRPSIAAIQTIESELGLSLGEIASKINGAPDIKLMIETLYQGFIAGDNKVSRAEIQELLEEEGLPEMWLIVGSFFTIATAGKKYREASVKVINGLVAESKANRIKKLEELQKQLKEIENQTKS